MEMNALTLVYAGLILLALIILLSSIKIVPQRKAFIVERLGKYRVTLMAGFNIIMPFIDRVRYRHTLKEQAIDMKASYGIDHYQFASIQIAQTTMRSIIGKLELDRTFEERETINNSIVSAVDKASDPWGVKVNRYEVKNIIPPQSIKDAMEKQMRAEREKRAVIAESEGEKQAKINVAEGSRQEAIAESEGEMQKRINEAKGKASEIEQVAVATANGIRAIAIAINEKGGKDAVNLRIAEQYLIEFGKLAKESNTMIMPSNLTDISSIIATATKVFDASKKA